jgi:hypothetical protein
MRRKPNLFLKPFVMLSFFGALLLGSVTAWSGTSGETDAPSFLGIFETGKGPVKNNVIQYVEKCCKDREAAIKLLEDTGFDIQTKKYAKDEPVNRGFGDEYFDEVVFGKRGPSWRRFWDIFSAYKVTFYMRDGQVDQIEARVERTMP